MLYRTASPSELLPKKEMKKSKMMKKSDLIGFYLKRKGILIGFLDASSHLSKRVYPSVGPSIRWSVGPLVRPSVRPSVRLAGFKPKSDLTSINAPAQRAVYTALLQKHYGRTDRPTDGRTDPRTDGRTNPLIEMR